MAQTDVVVTAESVEATIESFSKLDASSNQRAMQKLAARLGKEQPALLAFAASTKEEGGEKAGEAAVFYGTLVWAMFDRLAPASLPRITAENLAAARAVLKEELEGVEGLADKPIHERTAPALIERQPHLCAKLIELFEEDLREDAMTPEVGEAIFTPTQVIVEAFDAALSGRRPGEQQGTMVRQAPKVGRNEPCPCGSGKKYKKCHAVAS